MSEESALPPNVAAAAIKQARAGLWEESQAPGTEKPAVRWVSWEWGVVVSSLKCFSEEGTHGAGQFMKPIAEGRCVWRVAVYDRDSSLGPALVRGDRLFAAVTHRDRKGCGDGEECWAAVSRGP